MVKFREVNVISATPCSQPFPRCYPNASSMFRGCKFWGGSDQLGATFPAISFCWPRVARLCRKTVDSERAKIPFNVVGRTSTEGITFPKQFQSPKNFHSEQTAGLKVVGLNL